MPQQVQLIITQIVDEQGRESVNVNGPIQNRTLCYGMLERAKDAIRAFDPSKATGLVVPQNRERLGLPSR